MRRKWAVEWRFCPARRFCWKEERYCCTAEGRGCSYHRQTSQPDGSCGQRHHLFARSQPCARQWQEAAGQPEARLDNYAAPLGSGNFTLGSNMVKTSTVAGPLLSAHKVRRSKYRRARMIVTDHRRWYLFNARQTSQPWKRDQLIQKSIRGWPVAVLAPVHGCE